MLVHRHVMLRAPARPIASAASAREALLKFTAEAWDPKVGSRWVFAGTSEETKIEAAHWQDAIDKAFERFELTKHAMPRMRPNIMIVRCDARLFGTSLKQQGFGFRAKQEAIRWAG